METRNLGLQQSLWKILKPSELFFQYAHLVKQQSVFFEKKSKAREIPEERAWKKDHETERDQTGKSNCLWYYSDGLCIIKGFSLDNFSLANW